MKAVMSERMKKLLSDPDQANKMVTGFSRRKGEKEATVEVIVEGESYRLRKVNRYI